MLSLTGACRETIQAGRATREDWLFHTIQTKLAPGELEQLAAGIALLQRLINA